MSLGSKIMAAAFLSEMEAQIKALRLELEGNLTFRKYEKLQDAYHDLSDLWARPDPTKFRSVADATHAEPKPERSGRKGEMKGASVRDAVEAHFMLTGRRAKSSALLEVCVQQGIVIGSDKPAALVAAMLSNDSRFDNARDDRGIGYGLRAWSDASGPSAQTLDIESALTDVFDAAGSDDIVSQDTFSGQDAA